MAATKRPKEKNLYEVYIKHWLYKATQAIIQGRFGVKQKTMSSRYNTSNDWFSLVLIDDPEIYAHTKKVFVLDIIHLNVPIYVEISLKTPEGKQMILEYWSIGVSPEDKDQSLRSFHALYARLESLLRSILCGSRSTPAYRISRKQSPDAFILMYDVYLEPPNKQLLGDNYKERRIGQASTALGSVYFTVSYRTNMTITPTNTGEDGIMLKSDHFHKDASPKRYKCIPDEKRIIDLDKPIKLGALVQKNIIKEYNEDDYIVPEQSPFEWLLSKKDEVNSRSLESKDEILAIPLCEEETNSNNNEPSNKNHNHNVDSDCNGETILLDGECKSETQPLKITNSNRTGKDVFDDKLMQKLNCPFVNSLDGDPHSDLMLFYLDFNKAPALKSFDNVSDEEGPKDPLSDVTEQLQRFQTSVTEYDSLVRSLVQSAENFN